jgi:hypothetical protein
MRVPASRQLRARDQSRRADRSVLLPARADDLPMRPCQRRVQSLQASQANEWPENPAAKTCKANGINPQAYIADVTAKIAGDWPASRWDELLPWQWRQITEAPAAQAA